MAERKREKEGGRDRERLYCVYFIVNSVMLFLWLSFSGVSTSSSRHNTVANWQTLQS